MSDKLFVIAIGGTGMRCLESFVHLCAIGMFDNKEIDILTLDTDAENGNLGRVRELVNLYSNIKSGSENDGGVPNNDTFFSAKLNLHGFYTDYNTVSRSTYSNIARLSEGEYSSENKKLSDLFLDKDSVQQFNLAHGYRAQTHLGSYLMYHGIVEAAKNLALGKNVRDQERDLGIYLDKIFKAGEQAKVFVFGSVFGGTGASSIPVIPTAMDEAIRVRSGGSSGLDLNKVKFGSTLLTEYFSFKKPDNSQMSTKANSVIADSSFFPLNSQAALQFYQQDPTVQNNYKRLYHVGWPIGSKSADKSDASETITGGKNQKNACHFVELVCACAAMDFFYDENMKTEGKAEYLFRTGEFENGAFNLRASDLVGTKKNIDERLINKLGAFLSLAHLTLTTNEGGFGGNGFENLRDRLVKNGIDAYTGVSKKGLTQLDDYMHLFGYQFDSSENFIPGWIYQIRQSILPGNFIFANSAFATSMKDLKSLDVGKIFQDANYHWETSMLGGGSYQTFVKSLNNVQLDDSRHLVSHVKEKFIAHLHDGIMASQAKRR
jgi:hypothetical protein